MGVVECNPVTFRCWASLPRFFGGERIAELKALAADDVSPECGGVRTLLASRLQVLLDSPFWG